MNEDLSDMIKNFSEMLNNNNNSNNNDNNLDSNIDINQISNLINQFKNSKDENKSGNSSDSNSDDFNIDINTIMKMKTIMDRINHPKDDPRTNLLLSLKPYLRDSRKSKLDQYIKIFSIGQVMDVFKEDGGDSKDV